MEVEGTHPENNQLDDQMFSTVGLDPSDIVEWGPSSPSPKKGGQPPQKFGPRLLWPNGCVYQNTTWYGGSLSLGDIVLDGDPAPPPQRGTACQFSANVRCDQTAGWTKMPLGMEVGLDLGDVVLDGVAAPTKRGTAP